MTIEKKMQVVLITGLSGAGKTHAADYFEDRGYYCIDNMPPALIRNFLELSAYGGGATQAAFVCDIRSENFFQDMDKVIDYLTHNSAIKFRILFVEASTSALIRRYNETRRNHPLTDGPSTKEVIDRERELLSDLRKKADVILDTTNLKTADFDREMDDIFFHEKDQAHRFAVNIQSFGFKNGLPPEADMVVDVRFLPNPFYVASLRKLTGRNQKVKKYVLKYEVVQTFISSFRAMMKDLIPHYQQEGKSHLNLAFGCTGGQHRSVVMAEEFARIFREEGYRVSLVHRELD